VGWVDVSEPYVASPRLPAELTPDTELRAAAQDTSALDIYRCLVERIDLSQRRIEGLFETRLVGCKLTGTDLAGTAIEDTIFEDCTLGYTNLRMARLERVRFERCVLDEVDAYEARLLDVDFGDSRLVSLDIDKVRAERVDLRRAGELGLRAVGRLDGWLIGEHQLPAMMYSLAAAAGLGIERFEEP